MILENDIRKLARSSYWQNIYRSSKQVNGIHLFENQNNFSGIQHLFLYWLSVYSLLEDEFASQEWENLTRQVINHNIRCDAFLHWRSREFERKLQESKTGTSKNSNKKNKKVKNYQIYKGTEKEGNE